MASIQVQHLRGLQQGHNHMEKICTFESGSSRPSIRWRWYTESSVRNTTQILTPQSHIIDNFRANDQNANTIVHFRNAQILNSMQESNPGLPLWIDGFMAQNPPI
ncbi:hypothetical protein AJ78_00743 [Emergomyces pasteurianus Ep9510]|uniref:Uncharacterized protein n=1 Tax=Emergomyces pasteurianus Ep9510 TaxID=1447872 RepID=A0A1J9PSQ5_9EURO|nr:hypothetical protein AJ78_00743 [Emergomyces pasteurianus Ep9510]